MSHYNTTYNDVHLQKKICHTTTLHTMMYTTQQNRAVCLEKVFTRYSASQSTEVHYNEIHYNTIHCNEVVYTYSRIYVCLERVLTRCSASKSTEVHYNEIHYNTMHCNEVVYTYSRIYVCLKRVLTRCSALKSTAVHYNEYVTLRCTTYKDVHYNACHRLVHMHETTQTYCNETHYNTIHCNEVVCTYSRIYVCWKRVLTRCSASKSSSLATFLCLCRRVSRMRCTYPFWLRRCVCVCQRERARKRE